MAGVVTVGTATALLGMSKQNVHLGGAHARPALTPRTIVRRWSKLFRLRRSFAFIAPMSFFRGVSEAFLHGDVLNVSRIRAAMIEHQAFITCLSPTSLSHTGHVLFVALAFVAMLHLFVTSALHHFERLTFIASAVIVQLGCIAVLVLWRPRLDDQSITYVIVSTWLMADVIWAATTQCTE